MNHNDNDTDLHKAMMERMNFGFSTSCLFDMSEPHEIFVKHGLAEYKKYMAERIDEPLPVNKLFSTYEDLHENPATGVIICSRNSPASAMRAFNTLKQYDLMPDGACFTNGHNPADYVHAYKLSQLFTAEISSYERALQKGVSSSVLCSDIKGENELSLTDINPENFKNLNFKLSNTFNGQVFTHFVFDLDGVVFAEDSEIICENMGLEAFEQHEKEKLNTPIRPGPMHGLFINLHKTNQAYPEGAKPFKISVVTARSHSAFLRALNTFAYWGVDMCGEVHSIGDLGKDKVMELLKRHHPKGNCVFFDDKEYHVKSCNEAGATALHVPRVLTPNGECA